MFILIVIFPEPLIAFRTLDEIYQIYQSGENKKVMRTEGIIRITSETMSLGNLTPHKTIHSFDGLRFTPSQRQF